MQPQCKYHFPAVLLHEDTFPYSSSISLSRHQYHTGKSLGHAWQQLNAAFHAKWITCLRVCTAIMMARKKEGKKEQKFKISPENSLPPTTFHVTPESGKQYDCTDHAAIPFLHATTSHKPYLSSSTSINSLLRLAVPWYTFSLSQH
jgi:hypothetical protein